jgi:nucleotide-binding universal stress UspA family protein
MTILCATDYSPSANTAAEIAAALALRQHATLWLLHVIEPPVGVSASVLAVPAPPLAMSQPWGGGTEAAAAPLERLAAAFRQRGVTVQTGVRLGIAIDGIKEVARELAPSLIVLGTHGRKGAARLFLGSVAEAVVRTSTCPVLVTRQSDRTDLRGWSEHRHLRLALATDGSATSAAPLAWLDRNTATWSPELHVLRTYWPADEAYRYGLGNGLSELDDQSPELLRLIERDERRALGRHPALPTSELHLLPAHGDAAESVNREAQRFGADAIVIGIPRGRAPATAIAPAALLRVANVPVLCVPATQPEARETLPQFQSILIATDLSDNARRAVAAGYGLLQAKGGRVELCHVHERDRGGALSEISAAPPLERGRRDDLEGRLRALIPAEADALGIVTHVSVIEGLGAAEAIMQAARRVDCDVVVLASHGRTGLSRALLGSVAEEVARRCPRPVMIIPTRKDID